VSVQEVENLLASVMFLDRNLVSSAQCVSVVVRAFQEYRLLNT
jgi:hypothetical protein